MLNGDLASKDCELTPEDLVYLSSVCVQSLDLSHNYISFSDEPIRFVTFPTFSCLEYLDMSFHALQQMPVDFLSAVRPSKRLKYIDLSRSYVTSSHEWVVFSEILLPTNLVWLNLSRIDWFYTYRRVDFIQNLAYKT